LVSVGARTPEAGVRARLPASTDEFSREPSLFDRGPRDEVVIDEPLEEKEPMPSPSTLERR
jgi:hypothetical protein